ncbi:MAG: SH3 domain-containing protein [Phormidesmis sp.]
MASPSLKFPLFLLTVGVLLGITQSAQAKAGVQYAQAVSACQFGGFAVPYVRVSTQGAPLRVRATPAGSPIGLIPDGWAVRVLEWSRNGYWVKVTSHFGGNVGPYGFGSAPDFREGWVSAGYVKDLSRSCEKPEAAAQLVQPQLFGARPVEVQSDWLAMGDMLAASVSNRP